MGLKLTTDRYPPITRQTCYPLRHAASCFHYTFINLKSVNLLLIYIQLRAELMCAIDLPV